jgi:sortase A
MSVPRSTRRAAAAAVPILLLALGGGFLAAGLWIPVKAELAQQLLNRAWNASRADARRVRPWPWADTWPVARLRLPGSARPRIVLAGASGRNLAFGPALMEGSALPGTTGVSVIAGHRDTSFRALRELEVGDRFDVEVAGGGAYRYEITAIEIVDAKRARLRLDAEESFVALVTCYPFDSPRPGGRLRYVVVGRRMSIATIQGRLPRLGGRAGAGQPGRPSRSNESSRNPRAKGN